MKRHANHLMNKFNLPIATKDSESNWTHSETQLRIITVSEDQTIDQAISPTTLIQSTDQYLGTHNMPLLIQGPNQLDCAVSALWLRRLGWNAWLREEFVRESGAPSCTPIKPLEWKDELLLADRIIDIRSSKGFKASRLRGSKWIPRSQFNTLRTSDRHLIVCDHFPNHPHTEPCQRAQSIGIKLHHLGCDTQRIYRFMRYQIRSPPFRSSAIFPRQTSRKSWTCKRIPRLGTQPSSYPERLWGIPWKPINEPLDHPKSHLTTFYQKVHL